MTYSKSRPKILSSGIMDALSSFAYFVLAILFFVFYIRSGAAKH